LIRDAYELYRRLEQEDLLRKKPPMWWPNYGSFEVLVGAILTQNSQWTRVEVSLENLRQENALNIESLACIDIERLESLITPSGLFKSKAKYLQSLALAFQESFGDFGTFCREADREWLLQQKGVGPETADSILCYACKKEAMVVDAYTARLLRAFGYKFDSYNALQTWCVEGLVSHFDKAELSRVYALFHGMIVEYVKANSKAKVVTISHLKSRI
jgi:endonuclease III related protein